MRYRIEDDFDCSPERYWDMFFSDAYNAELWPALDMDYRQISFTREGGGPDLVIRREQILTPRRELPGFMKSLVQGALTYRELNVFTARNNAMEVHTIPSALPDRIVSRGTYRLEVAGDNHVRRIFEGECSCKIPLVGGKIEKQIVSEVEDSYRRTTAFTRRWLAEHPT